VEEPFDHATARKHVRAILESGMTTFLRSSHLAMAKEDMMSGDIVNVLRGGAIKSTTREHDAWRYESRTKSMTVEFFFRGRPVPDEIVVLDAWRTKP
jgi:hypothetical protein